MTLNVPGIGLSYSTRIGRSGNKKELKELITIGVSHNEAINESHNINKNKIGFSSHLEMTNYYLGFPLNINDIELKKINKIWIVFWL